MKKVLGGAVLVIFCCTGLVLARRGTYRIVDVFVCDDGRELAELAAMVKVSRKILTVVGHCNCQGINFDFRDKVQDHEKICFKKKMDDDQKKEITVPRQVYSCVCVGKMDY